MRALIYRSTSAHISGGHDRADRRHPLNVHNDVGTQTEDVNKAVFDEKEKNTRKKFVSTKRIK